MRINVLKLYVLSVCVAVSSFTMRAEESDMNGFIDQLMKKMNMPDKKRHKQHHNGSDHCKCKLADCLFLTQSRQYDKADDK